MTYDPICLYNCLEKPKCVLFISEKREQCLALIGKITFFSKLEGLSVMEVCTKITGKDAALCPCCKNGRMEIVHRIPIPDN